MKNSNLQNKPLDKHFFNEAFMNSVSFVWATKLTVVLIYLCNCAIIYVIKIIKENVMFAAYKKFWVQYADFSGRSSRSDYWWVVLCNFLITLPFSLIAFFGFLIPLFSEIYYAGLYDYEPDLSGAMAGAGLATFIMFLLAIYGLATIVPNLAITVRRLRDAGFHWAFIFLTVGPSIASFIPVLNILAALVSLPCGIALIVLLCQSSKPVQQVTGNPYGQQVGQPGFQGQQFGQPQNQQFGQSGFQGQQFGQPQAPVQNQQFGQPQQPVQNQLCRSEERRVGKECRSRWSPYH